MSAVSGTAPEAKTARFGRGTVRETSKRRLLSRFDLHDKPSLRLSAET
jgi:hypothetical protein